MTPSSPTVAEVLRRTAEELGEAGSERPRLDAERLLGHALGIDRVGLYMHADRPVSASEVRRMRALVDRRSAHEPLQYVLGEWGFRGLTLAVDRRALIPRPETEVVVERCLALLEGTAAPRVLDVGTGTGAIALAIATEHAGARVTALDVSEDALALAAENARRTGVELELVQHDLFAGLPGAGWDLVVSNPPYVRADELGGLGPEVLDFEPEIALVDRGQTAALARHASSALAPRGALVLETHGTGAAAVASLLTRHGYHDVAITEDLAGRERVVEGRTGVRA